MEHTMSTLMQSLLGGMMLIIGGIKTWLHMGTCLLYTSDAADD